MSYTPPSGDAANASWLGAPAYTPPAGDAADASWATASVPDPVEGDAAGGIASLALGGGAVGAFGGTTGASEATLVSVSFTGAASGGVGAAGAASAPIGVFDLTGVVTAQLVTAGPAAAAVTAIAMAGAAIGQHPRYELRGQVRLAGNPVERRVRAYSRGTGALLGQADTSGGWFRVHAGFAEIECTVLPIDLADGATDYEPPTANRVVCVMAEDAA